MVIFQPAYFPNIATFQAMLQADVLAFETGDFFQKQTYRTRCHIYSANGLLTMNIPVKHDQKEHRFTRDVRLENDFAWQKNHFKTLQNAYRSSPYFEYFEEELAVLYQHKDTFLLDFIFRTIDLSFSLLQVNKKYKKIVEYNLQYPEKQDFRCLVNAKTTQNSYVKSYTQVFEAKHGFVPNLSIVDLLFNEGNNAISYLEV